MRDKSGSPHQGEHYMRGIDVHRLCLFLASLSTTALLTAQTQTPAHLRADGVIQPETFVGTVLQAPPETPDCSHLNFGPHLTQVPDPTLGSYVFVFNSHVVPDNDRCSA